MRTFLIPFGLLLICIQPCFAQSDTQIDEKSTIPLEGEWTIDLRPTPASEAYLKEFVIVLNSDRTFSGEFYGSPVINGLINRNWDNIYFAFSTNDESNTYFHSGYLFENKISGITYCPDRDFVAPWSGMKKK
jgi:hypothetical protein